MPKAQQPKRRNARRVVESSNRSNTNAKSTTTPSPGLSSCTSTPTPPGASPSRERHIPRPANCFLLFRKDYADKHRSCKEESKDLSRQAAQVWHRLPQEEKDFWFTRAAEVKDEHARQFPDYKFKPKQRKPTSKEQSGRKAPGLWSDSKKSSGGPLVHSAQEETATTSAAESQADAVRGHYLSLPSFEEGFRDIDLQVPMNWNADLWSPYQSTVFHHSMSWELHADFNFGDASWDLGGPNLYPDGSLGRTCLPFFTDT